MQDDATDAAGPVRDEPAAGSALAALDDDGSGAAEALLAALARQLQAEGRAVRGLLMSYPQPQAGCAGDMVLVDLHTGGHYPVSQPLGPGAGACRSDPQGFARASEVLRAALADRPELVIVNRFGGLEAEGGGFAAEMLALVSEGVPVLTLVSERRRAAWARFSGGVPLLAARPDVLRRWVDQALGEPSGPSVGGGAGRGAG